MTDSFAPFRLPYGESEWQFGDLRLPDGPGPYPVVLSIHGGFWKAKYGLEYNEKLSVWFTRHGYATWNIEYRRVGHPGGGWPGTLLDVAAAADHLRALAPQYHLDLGRVVAIGHSAGGHLALWLAGRPKLPAGSELFAAHPLKLRGVISLAGVADLALMYRIHEEQQVPREESPVPGLLGALPDQVPERLALGSPVRLAPLGLPTVLAHGVEDQVVPIRVAEAYAAVAGEEAELLTLPGVEHFKVIDPEAAGAWPPIARAMDRLMG